MALVLSLLQGRIEGIETKVNDLQTTLNDTATRSTLVSLIDIVSTKLSSVTTVINNFIASGVLYIPRYTTTEQAALTDISSGNSIYNKTVNKLQFYNGSSWETIGSS